MSFSARIKQHPIKATVAAIAGHGLAGQIAETRMSSLDGNGSFRTYLLDALYKMTGSLLESGANVEHHGAIGYEQRIRA